MNLNLMQGAGGAMFVGSTTGAQQTFMLLPNAVHGGAKTSSGTFNSNVSSDLDRSSVSSTW